MRHLTIILTCVLQLMCLPLYSQQKGISIDMHDVPVEEIFNKIEDQSGYFFLYSKTIIDAEWKTSLSVVDKDLVPTLNTLFSGTGISYTLQNRQIVLSKQEPETKRASDPSLIDVNGVIQYGNGSPLAGALIATPDGTVGAISDQNGRFHMRVERGIPLEISLLGYVSQSVRAYPGEIKVTLEEDSRLLDDIVVVGYGTTSRKNLTTSISKVKTDNINKSANSNMSQLLLGRAAGLNATVSSAQPGGNVRLSIRGAANPIYVVDGIMMPSGSLEIGAGEIGVPNSIDRAGLAGLNPHDIESVEILKDAAASIYGIGAANGVVLITTKKGSSGRPKIEIDSNFSLVSNHKYLEMLDGREYMNFANMFSKENYLYNNKQGAYGEKPYDGGWFPLFTPAQIEEAGTTNWQDYVLKPGSIVNQNITITGGSDAFRYYLGGNYYNYNGSVANAGMERFSLRTNISSQILPFLRLTAIANINQNDYNNSSVGADTNSQGAHGSGALQAALAYPSYIPLRDEKGDYSIYSNMPNPEAMLSINDRTKTSGYYVNFAADLDIVKDMLSFRGIYGTNRESGNRELYVPSDLYFGQMYKSRGHTGYSSRYNWTLEGTLNFSKMFADVVQVDAVVGMGKYMDGFSYLDVSYENAHDLINNDNIGAAEGPHYPVSGRGKNEKRSQFGRVSADILNRYVISATLRRDGTDKFFPDSKYALFPSVSIAWKLSNESFMKNISWMDLVKLRASYGETGVDELSAGALYGSYNPSDFHIKFNGNSTTYIPYIQSGANYPDVTWTKTIMKNVGIDFSLLNDRISGSFDIFRNDITRLIAWIPLSPLGMYGTRPVNGGHYKRSGWDATLNTVNITNSDFSWESVLTLSKYDIRWIERLPNHFYEEYHVRENEPMNASYFYKVTDIIDVDRGNMPESQKTLPLESQMPGYPVIEDRNGDDRITIDDVYMRNNVPDIYVGFGNTFRYKNLDLDVFMYGQFGTWKYNYSYAWANPTSDVNPQNWSTLVYSVWNSQTNTKGTRAGLAATRGSALPGNVGTDRDIQNASFLRVRNITLGYNITSKALGRLNRYISNIRVFADVQNPIVLTKFDGFDPEITIGGRSSVSKAEYPQVMTYSFGVKITF